MFTAAAVPTCDTVFAAIKSRLSARRSMAFASTGKLRASLRRNFLPLLHHDEGESSGDRRNRIWRGGAFAPPAFSSECRSGTGDRSGQHRKENRRGSSEPRGAVRSQV